jgi:hypothetical protein
MLQEGILFAGSGAALLMSWDFSSGETETGGEGKAKDMTGGKLSIVKTVKTRLRLSGRKVPRHSKWLRCDRKEYQCLRSSSCPGWLAPCGRRGWRPRRGFRAWQLAGATLHPILRRGFSPDEKSQDIPNGSDATAKNINVSGRLHALEQLDMTGGKLSIVKTVKTMESSI